jgi:hypothetical protein
MRRVGLARLPFSRSGKSVRIYGVKTSVSTAFILTMKN